MIKFGIIYPSSRNKSYDDTFLLEQRLLQERNRKKSLSYGERYMTIDEEDIIGWMPIEDLDEIKVGE